MAASAPTSLLWFRVRAYAVKKKQCSFSPNIFTESKKYASSSHVFSTPGNLPEDLENVVSVSTYPSKLVSDDCLRDSFYLSQTDFNVFFN